MCDFSKESVPNLLFEKVDAILIVDAHKDSYHAIKRTGIFKTILENNGIYKDVIEKLWFHFSDNSKITSNDYHVFIPMIGKFKGKYVDRIKLHYDDNDYIVQITIYPLDEECNQYMFLMDELDNSEYVREFLTDKKVDTIQNSFLFSMYVDLIKDIAYSINVTEISNNPQNYDIKYSEWRMMIVNMIWPEDKKLFLERTDPEYLKKNLLPGKTTSIDCLMKNMKDVYIWVKLIFSRANTNNEDDFRFVFMVQDINNSSIQLFETLKKYEELASTDTLTGIFNHGRIETEITNSIESFKTVHIPVTYMMIDIDYFKKVNDQFGHSTGNVVLKQFVKTIKDFFDNQNIIPGRWGGEEFICVCYDIKIDKARELALQLKQKIEQTDFEKAGHLTCSIGLTEIIKGDTSAVLFDRVDQAMYEAKSNGRNCVIVK